MAARLDLVSTLHSATYPIQQKLITYVQKQLSTMARAHAAEMMEKESEWGREREVLCKQIAQLEADRGAGGVCKGETGEGATGVLKRGRKCTQCAKLKKVISGLEMDLQKCPEGSQDRAADRGAEKACEGETGVLKRGRKCSECAKHKKAISGLELDLQNSQEDSQDRVAGLEERLLAKRAKLREYVQLLYLKDTEISKLELQCKQLETEYSELEDKYLVFVQAGLSDRREALEGDITVDHDQEMSFTDSGDADLSVISRGDAKHAEDAEFLRSMETELRQLIDRLTPDSDSGAEADLVSSSGDVYPTDSLSLGSPFTTGESNAGTGDANLADESDSISQWMGDEFEGLLGPGSLCLGNESDEDEF